MVEITKAVPRKSEQEGISSFCLSVESEETYRLLVADFILRDDKSLWESVKDLFSFAVKTAEASLRGSFELELVFVGDYSRIKSFQPGNLAGLIVNHARKLEGTAACLFYYSLSEAQASCSA